MISLYATNTHELHAYDEMHPESPERITAILEALRPWISGQFVRLHRFNEPITHLLERNVERAWLLEDGDTYSSVYTKKVLLKTKEMIDGACLDIAGARTGCAYVLCRPPGHHASPGIKSGFCHENNVATAVGFLREHGISNIAIYDFDVHHGDGTQRWLEAKKTRSYDGVRFASTHAYGRNVYPYSGLPTSESRILNVPLPVGTEESAFLKAFRERILPFMGRPEVLILSAGYDGHRDDPMKLMKLTTDAYRLMGELLRELNVPVLWLLEGGYNCDVLGECVLASLSPWLLGN